MTGATAELVRVGKGPASVPVGVVIRVARREDVQVAADIAGELLVFARGRLAKLEQPAAIAERDAKIADLAPELKAALVEYFDGLLSRAGVRKDVAFPLDPDEIDWKVEATFLQQVIATFYIELGALAFKAVARELGISSLVFDLESDVAEPIRARLGAQVKLINDTTREILQSRVADAVRDGLSIDDLVKGVGGQLGLADLFGSRAQTIALTETATAYNASASAAYRDSGLVDEVLVFDGPECGWTEHDDPDLADGSTRTLDEADDYPVSHPNCQRAFGAVVAR